MKSKIFKFFVVLVILTVTIKLFPWNMILAQTTDTPVPLTALGSADTTQDFSTLSNADATYSDDEQVVNNASPVPNTATNTAMRPITKTATQTAAKTSTPAVVIAPTETEITTEEETSAPIIIVTSTKAAAIPSKITATRTRLAAIPTRKPTAIPPTAIDATPTEPLAIAPSDAMAETDALGGVLKGNADLVYNQSYNIVYDSWSAVRNFAAAGNGYRHATSGKFTFHPSNVFTEFSWITYRGPDQGRAQVIVDGTIKETVDLYRATAQWKYPVTISGLKNSKHTIVIRAMNMRNPASTNTWVAVDGFTTGDGVLPEARTVYDDQRIYTDDTFLYGDWIGVVQPGALYGACRISTVTDATMKFAFSKSKSFTWVTARGPAYGKAAIYVDDTFIKQVDLYAASEEWQYHVHVTGLTYGTHIVVIKVLGRKNIMSSDIGIVADGFLVPAVK